MARVGRSRQVSEQSAIEAQVEGIDGNAPLLDLDDEDGDLLSQARPFGSHKAVACGAIAARWIPTTGQVQQLTRPVWQSDAVLISYLCLRVKHCADLQDTSDDPLSATGFLQQNDPPKIRVVVRKRPINQKVPET